MKKIILASVSPRRKELLKKIGIKFKVVESDFKEFTDPNLKPQELVKKLSLEKAKAVFKNHKDSIIIAADTIVVIRNEIIGKPKDKKDAKRMLNKLSGKMHYVYTGFTIIDSKPITKSVKSKVYFRNLSSKEIDDYVAHEKPFDKAGAYAVQEKAGIFIKKIEGDFFNVVGLPIYALARELKKLGVK